jgi:hypothetical protein
MKPLQLGINYGMGIPSLAKGLDRHPLIAAEVLRRHKARYPRAPWNLFGIGPAGFKRGKDQFSATPSTRNC